MTDIETDNEYQSDGEKSDYEEDELEIEISDSLRPSFDVLNPAELAAAQKTAEKTVVRYFRSFFHDLKFIYSEK